MLDIKSIISSVRDNRSKNLLDSKQEYGTYNDGFFEALSLVEAGIVSSDGSQKPADDKKPTTKRGSKKTDETEPTEQVTPTRVDAIKAILDEETDKESELAKACQEFLAGHVLYHEEPTAEHLEALLELEKVALSLASAK